MTQSTFEFFHDNIAETPFHQWLLPELVAVDEEAGPVSGRPAGCLTGNVFPPVAPDTGPRCRSSLPVTQPNSGRIGRRTVMGAALIDIAGHAAICAKVRHTVATVDMRVDYLRVAGGRRCVQSARW
jgi:hypothetical protein